MTEHNMGASRPADSIRSHGRQMLPPARAAARRFRREARAEMQQLTGDAEQRAQRERISVELMIAPFGTTSPLPFVLPLLMRRRHSPASPPAHSADR